MTKLLNKLFGKKTGKRSTTQDEDSTSIEPDAKTIELAPEELRTDIPRLQVGFGRSVGKVRDHNEDALYTLSAYYVAKEDYLPIGIYIVADGMGGHKNGEIASELAIRIFVSQIMERILLPLTAPHANQPSESIQEIMQGCAQKAHKAIMKEVPGSGTTVTAALIIDQKMTITHAGDSRAYLISPQGEAKQLTRDHSLVERMIELGQITSEEAAVHPQRNVLYRALGQSEQFSADISTTTLPSSGHVLLCSDGLWGLMSKEKMIKLVNQSEDPQTACQRLIDAANTAGGTDNISVVLIKLTTLE